MKVNIFIPKEDAIAGKINPNNYSTTHKAYLDETGYVQVTISVDEFARLEDKETGRSTENYTYSEFVDKHYDKR